MPIRLARTTCELGGEVTCYEFDLLKWLVKTYGGQTVKSIAGEAGYRAAPCPAWSFSKLAAEGASAKARQRKSCGWSERTRFELKMPRLTMTGGRRLGAAVLPIPPGCELYCSRLRLTLTRSVSEVRKSLPRLFFALVWIVTISTPSNIDPYAEIHSRNNACPGIPPIRDSPELTAALCLHEILRLISSLLPSSHRPARQSAREADGQSPSPAAALFWPYFYPLLAIACAAVIGVKLVGHVFPLHVF